jgi:hypothetical protein
MLKNGKLVQSKFDACLGMISHQAWFDHCRYDSSSPGLFGVDVYFDDFDYPTTQSYQYLLIDLINQITPCELVEIENKILIRVRTLNGDINPYTYEKNMILYRRNLIMLNFIRNLWHEPGRYSQRMTPIPGPYPYTQTFFKTLKEDKTYADPLERLLHANKLASQAGGFTYGEVGHSNAGKADKLVVRKTAELLNSTMGDTMGFLTGSNYPYR